MSRPLDQKSDPDVMTPAQEEDVMSPDQEEEEDGQRRRPASLTVDASGVVVAIPARTFRIAAKIAIYIAVLVVVLLSLKVIIDFTFELFADNTPSDATWPELPYLADTSTLVNGTPSDEGTFWWVAGPLQIRNPADAEGGIAFDNVTLEGDDIPSEKDVVIDSAWAAPASSAIESGSQKPDGLVPLSTVNLFPDDPTDGYLLVLKVHVSKPRSATVTGVNIGICWIDEPDETCGGSSSTEHWMMPFVFRSFDGNLAR